MRYRLVIFDFDGTLSDSFPWFTKVIDSVADEFRFRRVEERELQAFRRWRPLDVVKHLGIPLWKVPLVASRMRALMARDVEGISLFPGVDEVLRRLSSEGAALALVTSNSRDNACRILGPRNAALFSYYECGTSLFGKGARLRRVLARSGVPRAEAICIGDELRDLEAARSAGIAFGAVAWGYGEVEALRAAAPDELFTSMEDIAKPGP